MAGIEKRRSTRRNVTGKGAAKTTEKARDRRANRKTTDDAVSLAKSVGSRIFGVDAVRQTGRQREKSGSRRIRSYSFTRSRPSRMSGGMPPVLVRRGLADMATPSRGYKKPKRRYDVALNVPGAEVRLPSLPAIQVGWRVLSGLIVLLMAAATYVLYYTPTFQVDLVEVKGLERLELDDLDLALGITGEPVVRLDAAEIEQTLLNSFHGISEVHVTIGLPASVQLTVKERQPVAAWVYQDEMRWLDKDGIVFEPDDAETKLPLTVHAEILPVHTNPELEDVSLATEPVYERFDAELVSVILSMKDYLPAEAQMIYDDNHGLGWTDGRGWQVYFGTSLKEMDQKLIVYQSISQKLEADGIQPSMISVEFLHAPFYRTEQ